MTQSLSNDLRRRVVVVVAAVDGGMSRQATAKRFGIGVSTAIKWVQAWYRTGTYQPRPQGGDNRSHRIEAHGEEILALVEETPDMTLAEIAAHLESEHGLRVSQSTVWRFFDRRGITFKKPLTPASNSGLTCCGAGGPGSAPRPIWIRKSSSSSTRPAPRPKWRDAAVVPLAAVVAGRRFRTGTGRQQPSSEP